MTAPGARSSEERARDLAAGVRAAYRVFLWGEAEEDTSVRLIAWALASAERDAFERAAKVADAHGADASEWSLSRLAGIRIAAAIRALGAREGTG